MQFVNVRDFGAAGDGVANDAPALRKAFDAAVYYRRAVFIPAGKYRCVMNAAPAPALPGLADSGPPGFPPFFSIPCRGHLDIFGEGVENTIVCPENDGANPIRGFDILPGLNVSFRDLAIAGPAVALPAPQTQNAIKHLGVSGSLRLRNVRISRMNGVEHAHGEGLTEVIDSEITCAVGTDLTVGIATWCGDPGGVNKKRLAVINTTIADTGSHAMYVHPRVSLKVVGCRFIGRGVSVGKWAIHHFGSDNHTKDVPVEHSVVTASVFQGWGVGIRTGGAHRITPPIDDNTPVIISDCVFDACGTGIEARDPGTISNCVFKCSLGTGVRVAKTGPWSLNLTGCQFVGDPTAGVASGLSTGSNTLPGFVIRVSDSTFRGFSTAIEHRPTGGADQSKRLLTLSNCLFNGECGTSPSLQAILFCLDLAVTNCVFDGYFHFGTIYMDNVDLLGGDRPVDVLLANNQFRDQGADGFRTNSASPNIVATIAGEGNVVNPAKQPFSFGSNASRRGGLGLLATTTDASAAAGGQIFLKHAGSVIRVVGTGTFQNIVDHGYGPLVPCAVAGVISLIAVNGFTLASGGNIVIKNPAPRPAGQAVALVYDTASLRWHEL